MISGLLAVRYSKLAIMPRYLEEVKFTHHAHLELVMHDFGKVITHVVTPPNSGSSGMGRGDDGEMMRMKMVAVGGLCEGGDDIDSGVVEMEGVVWWRRGGGEGEGGVDVLVIVVR
ncbi:hypothetical protein Tco_1361131 [Tanacetum coccineum]